MKTRLRLEIRKLIKESLEDDYNIVKDVLTRYKKIGPNKENQTILSINSNNFNTEDLYNTKDSKTVDGSFDLETSIGTFTLVFIGNFDSTIYVDQNAEKDTETGMKMFGAEIETDIDIDLEFIRIGGNGIDIEVNVLEDHILSEDLIESIEDDIVLKFKEKLN